MNWFYETGARAAWLFTCLTVGALILDRILP